MATKKELESLQNTINTILENRGSNKELYVGYAYSQPRVSVWDRKTGNMLRDISPRLSKPQMYDWLHAFLDGLTFDE